MFCINAIGLDARCLSQNFPCFLAKIYTLYKYIVLQTSFYDFNLPSLQCASCAAKAELVIRKKCLPESKLKNEKHLKTQTKN